MTRILALTLAILLLPGCCCIDHDATRRQPALINHVVFFKLKDPGTAAELIADCDAKMSLIPGVVRYFCGRHLDTGRSTVDSNYDVGFYVAFDSLDVYRAYVEHPDHKALVDKWKPRWEWIKIYDVQDVP